MSDPHVLHDGHAPTPFTAAQIRAASPEGYTVDTVMELDGAVVGRARTVFTEVDDDGAVMTSTPVDEHGEPAGDPRVGRSTWVELQGHASFPAGVTTITHESIEIPLGRLDCDRYDVRSTDHVNSFWFSRRHPGMPVRISTDASGVPTTTVVAIHRS